MLWLDLARAAPNAAQNSEMRSVITNKLELLDVLVHRSPAVKRIERSQDEQAKLLLEQARKMFRDAQGQLESGDSEMLEAMLDEGLRTAGDASRRVVDAERRQRLDQERYQQLRQRALSFREALEGVMAEKGLDSDETTDTAKFDASLLAAGRAADQGKYAEANQKLQELTGVLEVALVRARDQDTLVYELKFDSPKEEYAYERERNRSHIMLLDMLRQSRPTSAQAAGHFEKLLERNEILKREAEAQAARGEIEEAVKTLEQGTASLVQALRIGGLAF
ncbi:MAG: hypothetical protein OES09_12185 [Gammaproteobacteria bacterium]|nr:hypothetical protein [Gammaproteobacteria bacterium]